MKAAGRNTKTRQVKPEAIQSETPSEPDSAVRFLKDLPDINAWAAEQDALRAKDGDPEAARAILEKFRWLVDITSPRGWPEEFPYPYAKFLRDAFDTILSQPARNEDANKALGLRGKSAGNPGGHGYVEDAIAACYYVLIRNGWRAGFAKDAITNHIGASKRKIETAAAAWEHMKDEDSQDLLAAARPYSRQLGEMFAKSPRGAPKKRK